MCASVGRTSLVVYYKKAKGKNNTQLGMEVYHHGQVAVDDSLSEILLILHIEGDRTAGSDGQSAWERAPGR